MSIIDAIIEKAKSVDKKLVLPEGQDPRVVTAAQRLVAEDVCKVLVLGSEEEITASCKEAGIETPNFETEDPATSPRVEEFANNLIEIRKKKDEGKDPAEVKAKYLKLMANRLYYANMLTRLGEVDGLVAGSIASTGDMLRASFTVIGTAPGIKTGSSCFLMDLANPAPNGEEVLLFADCGVNPDPDSDALVDIAIATAQSYRALVGKQPKIAFLSFSTNCSASHPALEKIQEAAKKTKERVAAEGLDIIIDGELQADAAIVPKVAASKCPDSPLEGMANVLIFPDLNSGNICYKLTQRLAGAGAYGPILQGLAKPVNDLSRGCSADDIYGVGAITVCQSI